MAFALWVMQALQRLRTRQERDQAHLPWRSAEEEGEEQRDALSQWDKEIPEWLTDKCRVVASLRSGMSILCLKGLALTPVWTPGFVGIFTSDDVTPDTSRRRALNFKVEEFLADARAAVQASVIRNLNALPSRHLVPSMIDFISECVEYYGDEVVLKSQLPLVSVVRPPGETKLLSCDELLTHVAAAERIFFSSGSSAEDAMRDWSSGFGKSDVAIVLAGERRGRAHYERDEVHGSLAALWPTVLIAPLHGVVLHLIAQAWETTVDELLQQDGWTHRSTNFIGAFRRAS